MLTETAIKKAKPAEKTYRLSDSMGLAVQVRPSGAKVWVKDYRFAGKKRTITLGRFPDVKLADARAKAIEVNAMVKQGEDPAAKLGTARPEPVAPIEPEAAEVPEERRWEVLCDMFIDKRIAEGIAHATELKLRWNLGYTCQFFAGRDIATIRGPEILALVERIQETGKFEKARDVHRKISQVFQYAAARGLVDHDPAQVIKRAIVQKKPGGHPGLTRPADVGALMRAIRGFKGEPTTRAGLLLSAYTVLRSGELRPARWGEIDFERAVWTVPGERMKGRYGDHLVPLSRQAVGVLEWLRPHTESGPDSYIFRCSYDRGRYMSNATMNAALRRLGYDTRTEHCHHGFRTTFSTNMNEQGWNRDWIERQLNHVDRDEVRSAYNKALYWEGRVRLMQAYADWLDEVERG